jgi:hypothetical protein
MRNPGGPLPDSEAKLLYTDSGVHVLTPGRYVICAVTKRRIALEDLKYWSAAKQEAYADAVAATKGMRPAS